MSQPILAFQRRFQVWHYTVSHGQLLLRSSKDESHPTRVDVLFKSVKSMHLPTLMEDMRVIEASPEEAAEITSDLGGWTLLGERVFLVQGSGFNGFVVAHIAMYVEDTDDYDAPSRLLQMPFDLVSQSTVDR